MHTHVRAMNHKQCHFGDSTSALNALIIAFKTVIIGNSLAVQWLELSALTAGVLGLIPGQGTKIPQAKKNPHKNLSLYNTRVNDKICATNFI